MSAALWQPIQVGDIKLPHRVVMAPLTRSRANSEGVPTELNAEYYAQRASMALIISEGTQPSMQGQGYLLTPGIHTLAQISGWRKVTDAVRAAGGRMFLQIMHAGRISHPENTPDHHQPVAPSVVRPNVQMVTPSGMRDIPEPRALRTEEIADIVDDFRRAARNARDAGADGVEIHGANGYLIQQFLSTNTNHRTDQYGGSVENRIRFAVEVATAIAQEIGPGRTGIRISPANTFNDISETDAPQVYEALVRELAKLNLAYLHVLHTGDEALVKKLRELWPGVFMLNRPGADIASREADIERGSADLIAIGAMSIANPDLVERIKRGAPLNVPDPSTFYGGGAKGYTDYPALD
ncbi:MAG: alkene reductase [Acidobacteriota bacterium]